MLKRIKFLLFIDARFPKLLDFLGIRALISSVESKKFLNVVTISYFINNLKWY